MVMNHLDFNRLILLAMTLFACGSEQSSGSSAINICRTYWTGEMSYEGSSLEIRACLKDDLCSDELMLVLDWEMPPSPGPGGMPGSNTSRRVYADYADFRIDTAMIREIPGEPNPRLTVELTYRPEFAVTLAGSRPTLTLTDADGETMIESTSDVTFDDGPCGGLMELNLDGTLRPRTD